MAQTITTARVTEICKANNLSDVNIWDLYIDTRIENRGKFSSTKCLELAIEHVAGVLKIEIAESTLLYYYLYESFGL